MRTLQHQLQDIADWIAGIDIDPKPSSEQFTEGALRAAWRAISSQPWRGDATTYRELCLSDIRLAMMGYPNGPQLHQRITRVIPSSVEHPFPTLAELECGARRREGPAKGVKREAWPHKAVPSEKTGLRGLSSCFVLFADLRVFVLQATSDGSVPSRGASRAARRASPCFAL